MRQFQRILNEFYQNKSNIREGAKPMKAKLKTKHIVARCIIAFLAIAGLTLLVIAGGMNNA